MTDHQTFAWILLSVPDDGGTLQDIIAWADGINHAIPSHHELQTSLGWLQARGLVLKEGKRFALTDAASEMLSRLRSPGRPMMRMWDIVSEELQKLVGEPAAPDDITLDETSRAYRAYKKDFWRRYRELEKGDKKP